MVSSVAIAAYEADLELEHDVKTLQRGGFDMTRVSVVGRDYDGADDVVAFLHSGRRARFFGKHGVLWTTLSGILFGAALVSLPGAQHMVILGSLASRVVSALQLHAPDGLSPLAGGLTGLGIPNDAALAYDTGMQAHQFLLIVQADPRGIRRARQVLDQAGFETFESVTASPVNTVRLPSR
jgi:hypothetical protein